MRTHHPITAEYSFVCVRGAGGVGGQAMEQLPRIKKDHINVLGSQNKP